MKIHATFKILIALAAAFFAGIFSLAADPITLRIELDRSVLPADTADRAIVKVAIDGCRLTRPKARPPVNLCIVLDRSGSMGGEKIQQAKAAAIEALNHLAPGDLFSLVVFDHEVQTLIHAARIGDNVSSLRNKIRQIQVRGNTAIFAGVSQGASEIRKNIEDARYASRIILLSDGQANVGPSTPDELGRLGTALMKEGISVTTIGLGLGYDEDLMARLALKSDGNTYFAENARDLAKIFDAELGDVLSIVARKAVVTIEFPEGVRPIRFVGREGDIRGQNAELTLNQIYGGQEKFVLVEIETPRAKAGSEREIARARIAYEDAIGNKSATLSAASRARFSDDKSVIVKSANHKVQADYADNRFAEVKAQAVELADAGKTAEAAKVIKDEVAVMSVISIGYGNDAVSKIAADNDADAKKMESAGMSISDRKNYRAAGNATVMQQKSSSISTSGTNN